MKKLIVILMFIPIIGFGQVKCDSIQVCLTSNPPQMKWMKINCDTIKSKSSIIVNEDKAFHEITELIGSSVNTITIEPITFITDKTIKEYIDWCNADSNKIIIGYEFIFEEHKGTLTGWTSGVDIYDSKYAPKDKNYIKYYSVDFKKPDEVYYLWRKQQQRDISQYYEDKDYIRAEPITKELEPTFIGFYEWLKDKKK